AFVERTTGRSKMGPAIVAEALVRVTGWGIASRFGRGPVRKGEY
ncbi:MAG: dolichol-phosphate mannosyltransferase, partial [Microcella sp.]|nr:dolichol-phosphate mannosyltransferase [Microcella sp.]